MPDTAIKIIATRTLSKQQKEMRCLLFQQGVLYYCQFTLQGKYRGAHFTVSFKTIAEASNYLDKKKRVDFDAIVNFLILQAQK